MDTTRMTRTVAIVGLIAAVLSATGCIAVQTVEREDRTDRVQQDLKGADEVDVMIDMGAGQLLVHDGVADDEGLMDAEFQYSVSSWKPRVEYRIDGGTGELRVRQPNTHFSGLGEYRYVWDLALTGEVPLSMDVDMGAGESSFELGELDMRDFKLSLGAGDATVDLVGEYDEDVTVNIDGGAGAITVRLPEDIGVRVEVDQGIGELVADGFTIDDGRYVNDAYADADVFIDVDINAGVGQIRLELDE